MKGSPRAFDLSTLMPPISADAVFPGSRPLTLDIGCGDGEFLLETARLMPGFNHIGVEIKFGRFKKAVRAADRLGADNVKFIHLEGTVAAGLFAPGSFERIYINFPDPWPKGRHHKHRIVSPGFVSLLGAALRGGGRLEVASDHGEYMEVVAEALDGSAQFENVSGGALLEYPGGRPQTRFEKIFRGQGKPVRYLVYAKRGAV